MDDKYLWSWGGKFGFYLHDLGHGIVASIFSSDGCTVYLCKDVNHWTYAALLIRRLIFVVVLILIGRRVFSDRYIYICRFMEDLYIGVQTSLLLLQSLLCKDVRILSSLWDDSVFVFWLLFLHIYLLWHSKLMYLKYIYDLAYNIWDMKYNVYVACLCLLSIATIWVALCFCFQVHLVE